MLDRKWVLEHLDQAIQARPGGSVDGKRLAELGPQRIQLLQQAEELRHTRKTVSAEIGAKKKAGENTDTIQAEVRQMAERIAAIEAELAEVEAELDALMLTLPNLPSADVPDGVDAEQNQIVREWGRVPEAQAWHKPHWETGEALGILEFERAAKVAGARFAFMRGLGARLELTLATWMMSVHAEAGYEELIPPYLVRPEAMQGTGQLPKFAEDSFRTIDDRYLIPTAEVPVTNFYRDEILPPEGVPKKFVAFSPCFRAEAGAAGRDTRGIVRVHQFHKVELVHFERPEHSAAALEALTAQAEKLLQLLELPYRTALLCKGDMGFSAAKTYDLEVWLPGQRRWMEISSCSTFGDFQARRANIRYRPEAEAKPQYVHTLNGSGLAVGRTVVAILENYQQADGTVKVPKVLIPRLGIDTIKPTA